MIREVVAQVVYDVTQYPDVNAGSFMRPSLAAQLSISTAVRKTNMS